MKTSLERMVRIKVTNSSKGGVMFHGRMHEFGMMGPMGWVMAIIGILLVVLLVVGLAVLLKSLFTE